jgi:hypothetical protein
MPSYLHGHAESARGISPRAAHRSVREPLDSHGSCHPRRLPPSAEPPGSSCCQLTKQSGAGDLLPLLHGHYPASSLLRSSPPLVGALVLSASWYCHLYLSLHITDPVLNVPYESPDKSHAAYTPDTAWPVSRNLPCCSQGMQKTPVLVSGKGFRCFRRRFVCTHLSYLHMTCS